MSVRIVCLLFCLLAGYCQAQTNLATLKTSCESASSNLDAACEKQKAEALTAYNKRASKVHLYSRVLPR